jgi:D-alanyl-D-alanine dipeptidase
MVMNQLVDLENYSGLKFDIRYARTDNFLGKKVYQLAKAYLLKHVAEDLNRVHQSLAPHGCGLLIFDGYRPWSVTKLFWDLSSEHDRQFLADPEKGSSHNRGCAIDLTLYSLQTGEAITMPSDFDEMNEKSYPDYTGGTEEQRYYRDLLQTMMLAHGFQGIKNEWWHFNHHTHQNHPVMYLTFEEVANLRHE